MLPRSRTAGLLLCLVIALVVRALALAAYGDVTETHGDETHYLLRARALAAGEGYLGSYRPPGYAAFLAAVFTLFGEDLNLARWIQVLVSLLAVAVVHQMSAERFGPRAGLVSGLGMALMPPLAHFSHFLWSECLMATVLILFFWILARYERTQGIWFLVLAGLWLGLAALVRETWAMFAPLVALWIVWGPDWRRRLPRAVLFGACTAAVVLPWTWRNAKQHDAFVLISTCRWYPIAVGNLGVEVEEEREETGRDVRKQDTFQELKRQARGLGELEREAFWRGVALETIAEQQPGWIFDKLGRNTYRLFSLRSQNLRFVAKGWIPGLTAGRARLLIWTDVLPYLMLMGLSLSALWLVPGDGTQPGFGRLRALMLAAILFTLAVHVAANAAPRFVVPLMPLFLLHLGPLAVGHIQRDRWRLIGAGLTLVVFVATLLWQWERDVGRALEVVGSLPG